MQLDSVTVERLVEQITKEVLVLLHEEETRGQAGDNGGTCADCIGECVLQCKDKVQEVVNAGASRLTSTLGNVDVGTGVAKYIDHTLLKPDATQDQIAQLCYEARKYNFAAVCLCLGGQDSSSDRICSIMGLKGPSLGDKGSLLRV